MTVSSRIEDSDALDGADAERTLDKISKFPAMFNHWETQNFANSVSPNLHVGDTDVPEHRRKVTPPVKHNH